MHSPYVFVCIHPYLVQVCTNPYTINILIGADPEEDLRYLEAAWTSISRPLVDPLEFEDATFVILDLVH